MLVNALNIVLICLQGMLAGYQPESELSSNKLQIFLAILEVSPFSAQLTFFSV
jgi:hypothetical protein